MSKVLVNMLPNQCRALSLSFGRVALFSIFIWANSAQAQFQLSTDFGHNGQTTISIDDFHDPVDLLALPSDSLLVLANVGFVDSTFDYDVALMKLSPSGDIDSAFGVNGLLRFDFPNIANSIADEMVRLDDGSFLVLGSGYASDTNTYWPACLTKVNSNGSIDSSFGSSGTRFIQFAGLQEYPNSLEIDSQSKILVSGSSLDTTHTHSDVPVIARMDLNGNYDQTFGEGGKVYLRFPFGVIHETRNERHLLGGIIYDLLELDNGKILVCGGHSNSVNLIAFVACLNADGSLDETFFDDGYLAVDISTYDNSEAIKLLKGDENTVWFGANVQSLELRDFIIGKIDLEHQSFNIGALDINDNEEFMMDMIMGNNHLPLMIGRSKYPENSAGYYLSDFFAVASLSNSNFPYNSEDFTYAYNTGMQSGAAAGALQSDGRLVCLGFSQTQSNGGNDLALIALDDQSLGFSPNITKSRGFNIYPNPTHGPITIELGYNDTYKISVYNEMGQLESVSNSADNIHSISLEGFASGLYAIKITGSKGEATWGKVLKR